MSSIKKRLCHQKVNCDAENRCAFGPRAKSDVRTAMAKYIVNMGPFVTKNYFCSRCTFLDSSYLEVPIIYTEGS